MLHAGPTGNTGIEWEYFDSWTCYRNMELSQRWQWTFGVGGRRARCTLQFLYACRETFKRLTGKELKGASGPSASNTERSPDLLAETGFVYQTDWKIDDQPLPIKVKSGKLVCVPYTSELNDAPLFRHHFEADYYADICKAQFDQLYEESDESGRLMCIAIHPYAQSRWSTSQR